MHTHHDSLSRRRFLMSLGAGVSAAAGAAGCAGLPRGDGRFRGGAFSPPVAVATWDHGAAAVAEGFGVLAGGGSPLDAVERGINLVEQDPSETSVGIGGLPNADGVVQLDAAIMDGDLRCGSVLALEGIDRPISVARLVMETTPHVQLAGPGALAFARARGFEARELLTPRARQAWERWKASAGRRDGADRGRADAPASPGPGDGHDTIGMVVLGRRGRMAAGCSTSGLAWKLPGRVGDSPIVGAGVYCDGAVGGAAATGVGEEVLRVCGSFLVVEAMRRGASPQEAVEEALGRIVRADPRNRERQVAFIALSRHGEVGAGSIRPGFQLAVHSTTGPRVDAAWSLVGS